MALGLGVSVGLMGRDFTTKTQIRGVKGGFPRILIKCRRWFSDVISDGFNIVAGLFGSLAVSPYRCCELVIPAGCLGWQFCFTILVGSCCRILKMRKLGTFVPAAPQPVIQLQNG